MTKSIEGVRIMTDYFEVDGEKYAKCRWCAATHAQCR
jgi:hypothetical protein